MPSSLPSSVVFGSLSLWPSVDQLDRLHKDLTQSQHLSPVALALQQLPAYWDALASFDPAILSLPGRHAAEQLASWASTGAVDTPSQEAPHNRLTMPVTIIGHLCEYLRYLQHSEERPALHRSVRANVEKTGGGYQGFCAGLLSALAAAGATDEDEIGVRGALFVRCAFAIGVYIDLDALSCGDTSSLAVRWKSPETLDSIQKVVEQPHGSAYISVQKDTHDATITASRPAVAGLAAELSGMGVAVLHTGLLGRYHSAAHGDVADKIMRSLEAYLYRAAQPLNGASLQGAKVRSNFDGQVIAAADDAEVIRIALRCILLQRSNWHAVMSSVASALHGLQVDLEKSDQEAVVAPYILSVGADAVPSSVAKEVRVVKASKAAGATRSPYRYPDHAIAVIGMACKFPGADSVDEFWQLLKAGTSMVELVPSARWPDSTRPSHGKSDSKSQKQPKYWGNFMRDVDCFDHRFFKKSAREAASMDPQQRLLLQTAYEAMESSGYLSPGPSPGPGAEAARQKDIGCYLGLCATDYDANTASHPPNAFSTLGTLRAFLSGKISHFFGWSGPSLTFDTACSSSAVAIHTACRALQANECSQAVAGGVSLFTTPYLYENLSAAHFLSPTGATKPFDAKADGYCRGEGLGLIVLKKLTAAVADGDNILSVITGSALNQNDNCVPIMVPYSASQGALYERVAKEAGISPLDVSFVEAHGTGTPVGDPIEMESIRNVFGGSQRRTPLVVSSVKGNIGHLEGASGVAGIIKAILQIQNRTTCVQASFSSLNPKIPALEPDRLTIPTRNQPLPAGLLAACVNNYGAAGSNSAIMLLEAPKKEVIVPATPPGASRYPFLVTANSTASLLVYCSELRAYCQKNVSSDDSSAKMLQNVAFSLAKRQNQDLQHAFLASSSNIQDLLAQLAGAQQAQVQRPAKPNPVVLAFGGQVNNHVGLNKQLWQSSTLLRFHLDQCDETLRGLGYGGLYPAIFQTEPITNIVSLHSMVFALQYAGAMSWKDSGLKVDAVIGHSLGQLTAFCVSGALSLQDGLKFVTGRATIMTKLWGPEPGSMIAVESDIATISDLLRQSQSTLEIACYNGPTSHVLVGDAESVDSFAQDASQQGLKFKKLSVTNGFHSKFTDTMIPHLTALASTLNFRAPSIPIETCSDSQTWTRPEARLLAEHTRAPVFFGQAVQRLANSLGPCTWLEAGADSSVAAMVRRALTGADVQGHAFHAMTMNKPTATDALVDTTLQLWNKGHSVQFWNFHRHQGSEYETLRLPSYQFEKNKHWLDIIPLVAAVPPPGPPQVVTVVQVELPRTLITLTERESNGSPAIFRINPDCDEYKILVAGHRVAGSALCPATVYIEMAARACRILVPQGESDGSLIAVRNLNIGSPCGMAVGQEMYITLQSPAVEHNSSIQSWAFSVSTSGQSKHNKTHQTKVLHCEGIVELQHHSGHAELHHELERYERLTEGTNKIEALFRDNDSESVRGKSIYKMFARVVEYADCYQGIKSVAAKDHRIAGTVAMPEAALHDSIKDTLTQPPLMDSFMQLAGLHANNIYPCAETDVYVFTKMDRLQLGPGFRAPGRTDLKGKSWKIFSNLNAVGPGDKELANDIFVFDAETGRLVVLILGARFTNVKLKSLTKVLSSVNSTTSTDEHTQLTNVIAQPQKEVRQPPPAPKLPDAVPEKPKAKAAGPSPAVSVFKDICVIVENLAEVPREKIKRNVSLEDVGVDSLMMMEVISEISDHFSVDLPIEDLLTLPDVGSFVDYLVRRGCGAAAAESSNRSAVPESKNDSEGDSDSSDVDTSSTLPSSAVATPPEPHIPGDIVPKLAALLQEHLELPEPPALAANLGDLGLDSLLCIELASDIEDMFSVEIDMYQLNEESSFRDLVNLVKPDFGAEEVVSTTALAQAISSIQPSPTRHSKPRDATLVHSQQRFEEIRLDFDKFSREQQFANFWTNVYPDQAILVISYIDDAFKKLGVDLRHLPQGKPIPRLQGVLPKHSHLVNRLHKILSDGGYASVSDEETQSYTRTSKPFTHAAPQVLLADMIRKFPAHEAESLLLNITGSRLAECLTGKVDPLQILFANKTNRQLMADVYDKAPMCQATTQLLSRYLLNIFSSIPAGETVHLLEVGGGTGGTTRFLVDTLTRHGISFTYTFTDISSALVGGAKKKFAAYDCMRYLTLDCEKAPAPEQVGKYHVIISTNCIHATSDATLSLTNLRAMLRPEDGIMALVEFTRGLYWFDLVYGLLEGWWLFGDGRKHALADEWFWNQSLRAAGYEHVSWTDGDTEEAKTLRFICGFTSNPQGLPALVKPAETGLSRRAGVPMETVIWKREGELDLCADIYYPPDGEGNARPRPVALLIHGGGHVVFSRRDIHMKHIKMLLQRGFLPVSTDYRLCPEMTLATGPMADSVAALRWVREILPGVMEERIARGNRPAVTIDATKVAAVGWSSGGHLAMTLGYAAKAQGVKAPDVILAFYCPSNFEDEWWTKPIYPRCVREQPGDDGGYDLLEGVRDQPITSYHPSTTKNEGPNLGMSLRDERWRLIIHYNWNAQLVPLLIKGLPSKAKALATKTPTESLRNLAMPSLDEIRAVSPYGQIILGHYQTPTFMVHGLRDDLIPWEQSRRTIEALRERGVEAHMATPDAGHAFDLFRAEDPMGTGWAAVDEGYAFVCRHVFG
ncbi:hypothetical protein B0T22DRAFT_524224 [Podospora appendiculata]|uniref:Polyketide synthase n=1 Tax=Podospora appendiculata TaxID=314037 RepID=A0AAE0WYV2_9PEZI|nr:hypothetical protein B0T22DRAFT_524224 [Podospora appendiculata]